MITVMVSARAELLRLRRWPALWVMLGVWLLLNIIFDYVFTYLGYRNGGGFGSEGVSREELFAGLMPAAVPEAVVQGMPMFGGAIMLTLGALAAGSGYGWGTWKSAFTQGPGRLAVAAGTLVALAVIVVGLVVVTFAVDLGISSTLATIEGQSIVWPAVDDIVRALSGGVLILGMWVVAGVAVGTLSRSPALAVGLGAVWVLVVENLLRGAGTLLDWLGPVTDVMPGTVAGSFAAALGATPVSEEGGTPGVVTNLSGGPAVALALAYLVAFAVMTGALVKRRDID
ncbi:ABC transporter permease [Actinomadura sp. HBU206391]|uniref:ABC transporter permease n=1 Tax=Actinomadura sp. HBU206391 TaxID=2731692 RepID=UPI00165024F7|nr:ABC transporter permease [Actinomadura sp. HBU206391]MBC6459370.1 ABC transporter permease [Actinomadura sp. HBU206391]